MSTFLPVPCYGGGPLAGRGSERDAVAERTELRSAELPPYPPQGVACGLTLWQGRLGHSAPLGQSARGKWRQRTRSADHAHRGIVGLWGRGQLARRMQRSDSMKLPGAWSRQRLIETLTLLTIRGYSPIARLALRRLERSI